MIVKWIVCKTREAQRERFARGQEHWSALRYLDGFLGQFGGWEARDPETAGIVALWRDERAYGRFMAEAHDRIYDASGQAGTCESISVLLAETWLEIPGSGSGWAASFQTAAVVRVADCTVKRERVDHFMQMQTAVWNPGMAEHPGMLQGVFARVKGEEQRFLVLSLWADQAQHDRYAKEAVAELAALARLEEDVERIAGAVVRLHPAWTVAVS